MKNAEVAKMTQRTQRMQSHPVKFLCGTSATSAFFFAD
jgi:hypothetical protein